MLLRTSSQFTVAIAMVINTADKLLLGVCTNKTAQKIRVSTAMGVPAPQSKSIDARLFAPQHQQGHRE